MIPEIAQPNDHKILTELTKKSKAYWGYSEEQLLVWDAALTITQEYIATHPVFKLVVGEKIVGYYSYISEENNVVKLDNLFVNPEYIGKGMGSILLNDFINRMKNSHCKRIYLDAEPYAENFYKKHGFQTFSSFETSIKGRFMPIMELIL